MPVRSVLEVDVNDEAFQTFLATFDKYKAAVNELPGAWAKAGQETNKTEFAFVDMASALMAQNELLHKSMQESTRLSNASHATASNWRTLARETKNVAGHITDATKQLLKWASLTTVFSGLLGAGGLFGIDRLAESAGNSRRSAQGLNLTIGEQKAFETEFGRVVDPDQFLSGVNDALTDVTKRRFLFGAGLTEGDLRGKDTAQVAAELLPHLKAIVDQTPQNQLQNVLHARGLDQFLTLQDAQRLKATPADQLQSWLKQYEADRRVFQPPPGRRQSLAGSDGATRPRQETHRDDVHHRPGASSPARIEKLSDCGYGSD